MNTEKVSFSEYISEARCWEIQTIRMAKKILDYQHCESDIVLIKCMFVVVCGVAPSCYLWKCFILSVKFFHDSNYLCLVMTTQVTIYSGDQKIKNSMMATVHRTYHTV